MFSGIYLGMTSFTASLHKVDECEINGLPRLPHSINILGRFEELKCINHSNLCKYVDAKRDKHERLVLATEYYLSNWEKDYPNVNTMEMDNVIDVFVKLISTVEYLHQRGIIVRNIAPKNIYWTNNDNLIKLGNYGLHYITNSGLDIDFPLGDSLYLPPEALILSIPDLSCSRTDVWSLGILLLQAIVAVDVRSLVPDMAAMYTYLDGVCVSPLDSIVRLLPTEMYLDASIINVIGQCLLFDVYARISASKLRQALLSLSSSRGDISWHVSSDGITQVVQRDSPVDVSVTDVCGMYYLWSLAGGDLWRVHEQVCDDHGKLPSILTLPCVIQRDGEAHWPTRIAKQVKTPFYDTVWPLPLSKLMERLEKLPPTILLEPLLTLVDGGFKPFDFSEVHFKNIQSKEERIIRSQPIWVKETDFEYQFRRIIKFRRLIRGYPLTKNALLKETSFDIPPLLRSEIWPLLLGIDKSEASHRYLSVHGRLLNEKSASQIAVDLPRCHSYDELIVSSTGQSKLARILHAWLIHHPGLEYTQGMDSLCAVFTRLLYNNEALAFACVEAFVDKFMVGLFCSSHGQALTEYCTILQQLLSFHKPNLSQAVDIFSITGFTASWIYTGFAHSLPLDKTIQLWDTVIIGEPSFLMMVFIALLGQLDQESGFSSQATEQVFSVLSNLPEFDLDRCRLEAIDLAKKTPSSATYRSGALVDSSQSVMRSQETVSANVGARISLNDLLLLIGENVTTKSDNVFSPFAFDPHQLPPPILIDLRKKENFDKGSVPGSVNLPVMSASPHTTFAELEALNARAMIGDDVLSVKIIIGTVDDSICDMVAKAFIYRYRWQYVCILRGGINEVRSKRPDILIVTH